MIAEIRLRNYRSYSDQTFNLSAGVNIVVGPNASGKTNLLEALVVACRGASYRAADAELIKHDQEWSRIDLITSDQEQRTVKLSLNNPRLKQFEINQKIFSRLGINHRLPVVLFEPNHLSLLSGSPEARRTYLDGILEQTTHGYTKTKNDYLKTLRQRNSLLKSGLASADQLFPWNIRLSQLGGQIANQRSELIATINQQINEVYFGLAQDKSRIDLSYHSRVKLDNYQSLLLKKLEQSQELDILRGFTADGPHREDMLISFNNEPLASVASRGENRSLVISFKIIEQQIIYSISGIRPLILLDDVFSELDIKRRQGLAEYIAANQTIITTTNADTTENISNTSYIKLT